MIGNLYYFDKRRGYGFIESDEVPLRAFVHVSNIDNAEDVVSGAMVTFDKALKVDRGYQAFGVHVIVENDGAEVEDE